MSYLPNLELLDGQLRHFQLDYSRSLTGWLISGGAGIYICSFYIFPFRFRYGISGRETFFLFLFEESPFYYYVYYLWNLLFAFVWTTTPCTTRPRISASWINELHHSVPDCMEGGPCSAVRQLVRQLPPDRAWEQPCPLWFITARTYEIEGRGGRHLDQSYSPTFIDRLHYLNFESERASKLTTCFIKT